LNRALRVSGSRLLLKRSSLLDQRLLGLSRPQAFRATGLRRVHLSCSGFARGLARVEFLLDLFIEIGRLAAQGLAVALNLLHFVIGEFPGGGMWLFLRHNI